MNKIVKINTPQMIYAADELNMMHKISRHLHRWLGHIDQKIEIKGVNEAMSVCHYSIV